MADQIQFTLKYEGKSMSFRVKPNVKLAKLIPHVKAKWGVDAADARFKFVLESKPLKRDSTIEDNGIANGSEVTMVNNQDGGGL